MATIPATIKNICPRLPGLTIQFPNPVRLNLKIDPPAETP